MIKASNTDKKEILELLQNVIIENVYLYIDVLNENIESESVAVWLQRAEGKITQIVLQYHGSFQIYSQADQSDYTGILNLINDINPSMISAETSIIRNLYKDLSFMYKETYGRVLKQPYVKDLPSNVGVEFANADNMLEIAELICSDKGIGEHYEPHDLQMQFIQRLADGNGRNLIIKQDDKIVAHYATYAEAPGIAVMGGLIVLPEYRGKGYARYLHSYLANMLIEENMTPVLFCHDEVVLSMYKKLKVIDCSGYGKLTKIPGVY